MPGVLVSGIEDECDQVGARILFIVSFFSHMMGTPTNFHRRCIRQTFEKSQGYPSCRKSGHLGQLRKIDLHLH